MSEGADYFEYLRGRSRLSWLYRRMWLYPRLNRHIPGRVLDVGCGIGDFLASRPGSSGVDINPLMVDWCRERGLDARVMENGRIPFGAGEFDSVVLDNVLEHVVAPLTLLGEIHRVLRPDGTLVVGVPGKRGFASDPDHKTYYDEAGLTSALRESGFRVDRLMHMPARSRWLDAHMRQFCVYGVFRKGLPMDIDHTVGDTR